MADSSDALPQGDIPGIAVGQPGVLPVWHTPLIGRARDLERLLARARQPNTPIVTVTGPGGVGKTRLAVAAARELAADHEDGAVFVPLAPVRDPAFVLSAIARALALPDTAGLPTALGDRDLLLVLDNVEHVLAAAPAVAELLQVCPAVRVLATSRTRLNVTGETLFPVSPLEPGDAVALYELRARAFTPGFRVGAEAAVVGEICARLDGLPLAIELAAARSRVLTPRALLDLLPHQLDALAEGPRDAPERHRTLRGTIAWSHDLLDERERATLRRLAVFAGGFTLEAATAVAGVEGDLVETLGALIDSSLVRAISGPEGVTRYLMLETIREFALERLVASGEEMAMRELHARHYLALAVALESSVLANALPVTEGRVRRLHLEVDNLRGALAWLLDHDPVEAAHLASALDEYWFRFGYFAEGRAWLRQALDRAPDMPPGVRRRVLDTSGWLAYQQGDLAEAERRLAEAAPLHRASGDLQSYAWALGRLANVALARLEPDRARELLEEARRTGREIDDSLIEMAATSDLGRVLILTGEIDRAEATLRDAVRQHRERPGTIGAAVASLFLGSALVAGGKMREAGRSYAEALATFVEADDWANVARCAEGIARTVVATDPVATARLLGATTAIRERLGHPVDGEDQPAVERALAQARERLPAQAFSAAWSEGQALAWDALAREAAAIATGRTGGAGGPDDGLSERERAVLALLVEGQTDAEIASVLFISRRTVAAHLQNIYRKMEVGSRAEAAAAAVRRGLA